MLNEYLKIKTNPIASKENVVKFADYRITLLTDRLIRIEKDKNKIFNDNPTLSVWYRNAPTVKFSVKKGNDNIKIITETRTFSINCDYDKSYVLIDGKRQKLSNDKNLKGTYRTLDCFDGNRYYYGGEIIDLGFGVCSKSGVAIVDDTKSLVLDKNGKVGDCFGEELDVYVFAYGNDYKGAVKGLLQITGKIPLLPRYSLGNWWSRYYPYSDKTYLQLLDKFEEKNMPFTVATIDMDWHYSNYVDEQLGISKAGKNTEYYGCNATGRDLGWTGWTWNKELFPDYKAFLSELHNRGLKVAVNLHPAGGVRYFEKQYNEMAKAVGQNPKEEKPIKFDVTSDDFINAYFDVLLKPYEKDGVDIWWIDWQQGSDSGKVGLDPLWSLNHYHYLNSQTDGNNLILSRYSGVGAHRYPLGFSGDTIVTWDTMEFIPYFTITASNIGYGWWSHDIGGHMYGIKDDELVLRFVQFGVFSPINRLHSCDHEMMTKETWSYTGGKGYIINEYLRLRHKLMPFLHSMNYKCHTEGQMLLEPLYYYYPEEKNAYKFKNQYMFGGNILVAPITKPSKEKGITKLYVWLPKGVWTDMFTGMKYTGGKVIEIARWLEEYPVFIKEGSILPIDGDKELSGKNPKNLEIDIYSGNGTFDLFENDDENYSFTRIRSQSLDGKQIVDISFDGDYIPNKDRSLTLIFKDLVGEVTVYKNSEKINDEYLWYAENAGAKISSIDYSSTYQVVLSVKEEKTEEILVKSVKNYLSKMEGDNLKRTDFYDKLILSKSKEEFANLVNGCDFLAKAYKIRLLEICEIFE